MTDDDTAVLIAEVDRLQRELAETQQALAAATWSLVSAMTDAGTRLDTPAIDRQVIADDLLDRVGAVVAALTGTRVIRGTRGTVTLTAPPEGQWTAATWPRREGP